MPPQEKRVNFIIAGAQKAGTTALDSFLRYHPLLRMANIKETHFFDTESNFADGNDRRADYHAFFDTAPPGGQLGEATPIYMYWKPAAQRLFDYNPDMKWIMILRHPVERAFSHWHMEANRGADSLPFSEAIRSEHLRIREAWPLQHRVYSYGDRGFYARQLRAIWNIVPRDRTLILRHEQLTNDSQCVLDRITHFLGVPPLSFSAIPQQRVFAQTYTSTIRPEDRQWLIAQLADDICDLEKLLGWDCRDWRR